MERKLERQSRLSHELKNCLDFMRISDSSGSTRSTCPSERAALRSRLSQTANSDHILPLLSLSDRRRASKELKKGKLLTPGVAPIKEDFNEQLATPSVKNLRIIPEKADRSSTVFKYCFDRQRKVIKQQAKQPNLYSISIEQISKNYYMKQDNPFKAMYSRLVQQTNSKSISIQAANRVIIHPKISKPQEPVSSQPRKSIRPPFPTRPATPLRAGSRKRVAV